MSEYDIVEMFFSIFSASMFVLEPLFYPFISESANKFRMEYQFASSKSYGTTIRHCEIMVS
ncbi:MAG TPA: hypothetical protein PLB70_05155, partial [Paludibacteraceae bacterium]|nr:hypothetical protein [Paludibacteraceae bacterium]